MMSRANLEKFLIGASAAIAVGGVIFLLPEETIAAIGYGAYLAALEMIPVLYSLGNALIDTPEGNVARTEIQAIESGVMRSVGKEEVASGIKLGQDFGKLGTVIKNTPGKINGFSSEFTKDSFHGLDQAISRGVSPEVLKNTVSEPLVVLAQSGGNSLYLTREAVVVLDNAGNLVTTYSKNEFLPKIIDILNLIH